MLVSPRRIIYQSKEFELSVHCCPRKILRELPLIFPADYQSFTEDDKPKLLLVTVFQPTKANLLTWSDEATYEKNQKLEDFLILAKDFTQFLTDQGYWADLTDPCSGLPVLSTAGSSFYSDVEGMLATKLNYDRVTIEAGQSTCSLISHPEWGTACYPTTLFTTAPITAVEVWLEKLVWP